MIASPFLARSAREIAEVTGVSTTFIGTSLIGIDAHALTALWSMLLMSVALMGISCRVEKRHLLIEPDSFLSVLGYGLGLWLLFQ